MNEPIRQDSEKQEPQETQKSVSSPAVKKKAKGAFKTIREVAELLDVQQHVLRFWETKFSYIRPLKRGGGRRYYRPEDVALLQAVHYLLYTEGYTIKGVQNLFRKNGKQAVLNLGQAGRDAAVAPAPSNQEMPSTKPEQSQVSGALSTSQKDALREMLQGLKDIRALIDADKA